MPNNNQDNDQSNTSKRGFASMDEDQQREIASQGGKAAHEKGTAHEFDSEEAREAGSKVGQASGGGNRGQGGGNQGGGNQGGGNQGGGNQQGRGSGNDSESQAEKGRKGGQK